MSPYHLLWIVPVCLIIGFAVGFFLAVGAINDPEYWRDHYDDHGP